jgi:hypothetical protein
LRELREVEKQWYKENSCVRGLNGQGEDDPRLDEVGAPTGIPFGTVLPDWRRAVNELGKAIQRYMDYYDKEKNTGCGCPEFLHVVGFSDGATTIALYQNGVLAPSETIEPNYSEAYGMVAIIDMVRVSDHVDLLFGNWPNGDPDRKPYPVAKGEFVTHLSIRNESPGLFRSLTPNWTGIAVGWTDYWIEPRREFGHMDVPGQSFVKTELKKKLIDALEQRKSQCDCQRD